MHIIWPGKKGKLLHSKEVLQNSLWSRQTWLWHTQKSQAFFSPVPHDVWMAWESLSQRNLRMKIDEAQPNCMGNLFFYGTRKISQYSSPLPPQPTFWGIFLGGQKTLQVQRHFSCGVPGVSLPWETKQNWDKNTQVGSKGEHRERPNPSDGGEEKSPPRGKVKKQKPKLSHCWMSWENGFHGCGDGFGSPWLCRLLLFQLSILVVRTE